MAGWRLEFAFWAASGLTLFGVAAALASPPEIHQSADAKLFDEQFRPLLVRHCVACHGGTKPKGKLRLDNLPIDFAGMLQQMGIEADKFGSGTGTLTGLEMRS